MFLKRLGDVGSGAGLGLCKLTQVAGLVEKILIQVELKHRFLIRTLLHVKRACKSDSWRTALLLCAISRFTK